VNRIDVAFKRLRSQKEKAFIAYITAGDPSLALTKDLVLALERSGVDIIELGVPFSDPVADGPTIQAASQRALAKKTTVRKIFNMVRALRMRTQIPIIFMTYYNPVLRYGLKDFFSACRRSGVDGVIVPDLPCEESAGLIKESSAAGVAAIFLVAPTSTPRRVKDIARKSKGFIYYVSLTGVTGARRALPPDIKTNIRRIKSVSGKPVAVGFGVSNARQAAGLAKIADGVIVGSAIVKIIGENGNIVAKVSRFAKSLSKAIHSA
jgi:tryptophan synthase alpha chain